MTRPPAPPARLLPRAGRTRTTTRLPGDPAPAGAHPAADALRVQDQGTSSTTAASRLTGSAADPTAARWSIVILAPSPAPTVRCAADAASALSPPGHRAVTRRGIPCRGDAARDAPVTTRRVWLLTSARVEEERCTWSDEPWQRRRTAGPGGGGRRCPEAGPQGRFPAAGAARPLVRVQPLSVRPDVRPRVPGALGGAGPRRSSRRCDATPGVRRPARRRRRLATRPPEHGGNRPTRPRRRHRGAARPPGTALGPGRRRFPCRSAGATAPAGERGHLMRSEGRQHGWVPGRGSDPTRVRPLGGDRGRRGSGGRARPARPHRSAAPARRRGGSRPGCSGRTRTPTGACGSPPRIPPVPTHSSPRWTP